MNWDVRPSNTFLFPPVIQADRFVMLHDKTSHESDQFLIVQFPVMLYGNEVRGQNKKYLYNRTISECQIFRFSVIYLRKTFLYVLYQITARMRMRMKTGRRCWSQN